VIDFLKGSIKYGYLINIIRIVERWSVTYSEFISESTGNELFIISMRYFVIIVESLGKCPLPVECMYVVVV